MVTEPLEALVALLLISIILASVFIYNQKGTERIMLKRTMTRSIAGTVSGFYLYYLSSSQSFADFNRSVASFITYIGKGQNVSCSVAIELIFKNGSYFDYELVRGRKSANAIIESMTVAYGNASGALHIYAIVNRTYISSDPNSPTGVYLVAYYDNGVPALYSTQNVLFVVKWSDGNLIMTGQCPPILNGKTTCDISASYWPSNYQRGSGAVSISIVYSYIDGKYSGTINITSYPVYSYAYTANGRIADVANGSMFLHYYLGEKVNLTTDVVDWNITNRKGGKCYGAGNAIPTGSNILCGDMPLPVFLVQGPVNITLNYDKDIKMQSRQVIFIDPYFTQVLVETSFRG